jgi:hypothetical protein
MVTPSILKQLSTYANTSNSQAVVERGFDEKIEERRGEKLKMTTCAIACFRRFFAAKRLLPPPATKVVNTKP